MNLVTSCAARNMNMINPSVAYQKQIYRNNDNAVKYPQKP